MQPRMRSLFVFIFVLISYAATAQALTDSLQGSWHLYKWTRVVDEDAIAMEHHPPVPRDNLWIFTGDSLFRIYYPYQCESKHKVRIDSNRLFDVHSKYPFATLQPDSGRLIAFVHDGFQLYFRRQPIGTDSIKTVRLLQRDSVNYGLLFGRYRMVTHFTPDDEAAYDFKPPVPLPPSITITDSAAALKAVQLGLIYMDVLKRPRRFDIEEIRWVTMVVHRKGEDVYLIVPQLVLVPGEWWEGELFRVIYLLEPG